jgi:hypothetical protein
MPINTLYFPTDLIWVVHKGSAGSKNEIPNVPYIEFSAWEWDIDTNAKRNASMLKKKVSHGSVCLPMPLHMNDSHSINWETHEGIGAKNLGELAIKSGIDFARSFASTISKFVEAKKGMTSNDLQSLAFGLTNFREWQLAFRLMPKSVSDSQRLAEVIQFFKQQSITDFKGNKIDYPSFFTIKVLFPSGDSGTLFNKLLIFKASVITHLAVNYIPDGGQSFYRDGAPTAVTIDITLKELERIDRSDYNLGLG